MENKLIKQDFEIQGMHCPSCELTIEDKLSSISEIEKVNADREKNIVSIETRKTFSEKEIDDLINDFGYNVKFKNQLPQQTKPKEKLNKKELLKAFVIASIIMALFLLLQKLNLLDLFSQTCLNMGFVFVIGIIASLSTCMAVVGGIVLSISSTFSKAKNYKPMIAFHLARLLGFLVLGGIVGLIGSAFIITPTISFLMIIIIFFVMVIMGFNLLQVFPWLNKFQFKMPKSIGKKTLSYKNQTSYFGVILLGISTFILPCGFTQSMQIYSLSTGSFLTGAITMFVFALGTLPVLGMISFASMKFSKTLQSGLFFKVSGFLVLFFAIFNLYSGLRGLGI
jgi:sulfite exporter TauE/SafE/copper chaperone CopZ